MGDSLSYLDNLLPELTTIQCFLERCHKRRYTPLLFPLLIAYKSRTKVLNVILYTDPFLGLILLPSSLHFRFVILSVLKIILSTDLVLITI